MSLKVKSNWRIAANAVGLAVSMAGRLVPVGGLGTQSLALGFHRVMGVLGLLPVSRQPSQRAEDAKGTCTGST